MNRTNKLNKLMSFKNGSWYDGKSGSITGNKIWKKEIKLLLIYIMWVKSQKNIDLCDYI